ncbi:MAG: hypothetical protein OXG38_00480 [Chloroflexi bacterium]|nr:hypothetical protein [Chloroflexota bacterium]
MRRHEAEVEAGGVSLTMRYRDDVGGDSGLCIEVYADVDGAPTELLRFDCFRHTPHYHYGPMGRDERIMFDATADGDPLDWTLERFQRGRLRAMIERAGYPGVAAAVDEAAVAAALPRLIDEARAIVAAHEPHEARP